MKLLLIISCCGI